MPQAQRFCRRDFAHWDPKITTFPGLYLLSAAAAEAARAVGSLGGGWDGAAIAVSLARFAPATAVRKLSSAG